MPTSPGTKFERRPWTVEEAVADAADPLGDGRSVRVHVRANVAEGPAVAGEAEAGVELVDHVEALEELTGGVRRVAVVVVERDPPEQVVTR